MDAHVRDGGAKFRLPRGRAGFRPGRLEGSRELRATRIYVKQNVTVSLDRQTVRKVKILAAKRDTSISGLIAAHVESLVEADEAYERAKGQALALLDRGFHLGGDHRIDRSELHER